MPRNPLTSIYSPNVGMTRYQVSRGNIKAATNFFGEQYGKPGLLGASYDLHGNGIGLDSRNGETLPAPDYPGQYSLQNVNRGSRPVPQEYASKMRDYPQDLKDRDAQQLSDWNKNFATSPHQTTPVGGNPMTLEQSQGMRPAQPVQPDSNVDGSISPRMAEASELHKLGPTSYSDVGAAPGTVNVTSGGSTTNRAMPTQPLMYSGGSGADGTASVSQSFKPAEQPMQSPQQQVDQFKSTPAPQSSYEQSLRSQNFATGGMVRGPGTGTSDSIPAKLSDGVFIIPSDVVRYYGTDKLNKMVEKVGGTRKPIENKDGVMHAAQPTDDPKTAGTVPVEPAKQQNQGMIQEASNAMQAIGGAAGRGIAENYNTTGNQALKQDTTFSDILNYKGAKASGGIPSFSSQPAAQPVAAPVAQPLVAGQSGAPDLNMLEAAPRPAIDLANSAAATGMLNQEQTAPAPAQQAAPVAELPQAMAQQVMQQAPQQVMQQAPQQFQGGMQQQSQPDYSAQINQLVEASQQTGNSNSFDSMLAAKARRRGAQAALREIAGLQGQGMSAGTAQRGQDVSAQSEREKTAQAQANLLSGREADAATAARSQSNKDREFWAQEDQNAAVNKRAETSQGMTKKRDAQTTASYSDKAARLMQGDAERAAALKLKAEQIAGTADAYLTGQGIVQDAAGNYSIPGTFYDSPPSKEQIAEWKRLQFGGTLPIPKNK